MRRYLHLVIILQLSLPAFSQQTDIKRQYIGDILPASVFRQLPVNPSTKLIILDFWSTYCSSCVATFPKMEALQKKYNGQLQVILVNPWENEAVINKEFAEENIHRNNIGYPLAKLPATLPAISGDMTFNKLFPARSVPHHVWLDNTGKVLFITSGHNANEYTIGAVLKGEQINMVYKNDDIGTEIRDSGFLKPTLPTLPPIYYSAFIPYSPLNIHMRRQDDSLSQTYKTTYVSDVIGLFKIAFLPGYSKSKIVLEMSDKQKFMMPDYDTQGHLIDNWMKKFYFTYEIQGPLPEKKEWQQKMQLDVNYFFGNTFELQAAIEKRTMSCLVLVKTANRLFSQEKGMDATSKRKKNIYTFTNYPLTGVVEELSHRLDSTGTSRPLIDETGYGSDIGLNGTLTIQGSDLAVLRKELRGLGLDLIEEERKIEVLVIRDKPSLARK